MSGINGPPPGDPVGWLVSEVQQLRRDNDRAREEMRQNFIEIRNEIRLSRRFSLGEHAANLGPIGIGVAALLLALAMRALGINPGPWIGGTFG